MRESNTSAFGFLKRDNVNVHRAAAKDIVFKNRAARGSVCNVLLSVGAISLEVGVLADGRKPSHMECVATISGFNSN